MNIFIKAYQDQSSETGSKPVISVSALERNDKLQIKNFFLWNIFSQNEVKVCIFDSISKNTRGESSTILLMRINLHISVTKTLCYRENKLFWTIFTTTNKFKIFETRFLFNGIKLGKKWWFNRKKMFCVSVLCFYHSFIIFHATSKEKWCKSRGGRGLSGWYKYK